MQCIPPDTWNFVKLHLELKYLGRIPLALAKLHGKKKDDRFIKKR